MDKDEYQLYHAICKDTVPSANEKPVTEPMTCYKKLWSEANTWVISTILHLVVPVLKIRRLEVTTGSTFFKPACYRCS